MPGDKITALPAATSLAGNEITVVVQGGTTKQVSTAISRNPIGNAGGDLAGSYPSPTLAPITAAQSAGSASTIPVLSVDTKGRVTSLSTAPNTMGTVTNVTAGTGLSGGPITSTGSLNVVYGNTAGTAAQGNDSRFTTIPVASTTLPAANGAAAIGTSANFARADHVHPQASTSLTGDVTGVGNGSIATTLANVTSAQTNVGGVNNFPTISVDAKGRVTALSSTFVAPTAITALSGDITATGPGAVSAQLSASGVAAGTYGFAANGRVASFTVDNKGRIGAASDEFIVLPTDKASTNSTTLQFGSKPFAFSNPTGIIPYIPGQWVTIREMTAPGFNRWMSGTVTTCSATNVLVAVSQSSAPNNTTPYTSWAIRPGQTINISSSAATANQVLAYNNVNGQWFPVTPSRDATSLQGYPIDSTPPTTGDVLAWDGNGWGPQAGQSGNATSIANIPVNIGGLIEDAVLVYDQPTNEWITTLTNAY